VAFENIVINFLALQNITKLHAIKDSGASRCQYEAEFILYISQ
jgi:uncharacterized protein YjiS (DUF1127 family)